MVALVWNKREAKGFGCSSLLVQATSKHCHILVAANCRDNNMARLTPLKGTKQSLGCSCALIWPPLIIAVGTQGHKSRVIALGSLGLGRS